MVLPHDVAGHAGNVAYITACATTFIVSDMQEHFS
jgi:hypothetical protein